jgi:hypothetical protein
MGMALTTLDMILYLVGFPPIRSLFVEGSLPTHSAYLCLHLLDRLVGARDVDLTQCKDIHWNPHKLIADLVSLVLLLARNHGYVQVRSHQWPFVACPCAVTLCEPVLGFGCLRYVSVSLC